MLFDSTSRFQEELYPSFFSLQYWTFQALLFHRVKFMFREGESLRWEQLTSFGIIATHCEVSVIRCEISYSESHYLYAF